MTTAATKSKPAWQAEVKWKKRYYTTEEQAPVPAIEETAGDAIGDGPPAGASVEVQRSVWECFVDVVRPGCEPISFRVNHREGRDMTFSDPRDRDTGVAGVTGIWGTRPVPPVFKPRPLQQNAFRIELARLVGAERAEEIVQTILSPEFFLN